MLSVLVALALIPLPGTSVVLQEKPGDPVRLTAYGLGTRQAYLRGATAFARQRGAAEVVVSPDGRFAAAVPAAYTGGRDALVVTDRTTGRVKRIPTVARPLMASYASWSRDGTKVLLTLERKTAGKWRTGGYVTVDVAAGTARTTVVADADPAATYWWTPDGGVIAQQGGGAIVLRAGRRPRLLPGVGTPAGPDLFSPSGRRMVTWCPARYAEHVCLADPATGRIVTRSRLKPETVVGWWNESRLIAVVPHQKGYRLVVADTAGRVRRVLAVIPSGTWQAELWLSFTRK
ncbi:TolB family protein [Nonomuraea sp. NPDC004354]